MAQGDYPPRIPEQIRNMLENRRAQWEEVERVKNELLEANDVSPEEAQRRDELATRVFTSLGIADEVDELHRVSRARKREVIDKYFPREADRPDQRQGG
jgi:hypothetical protein